jgi:hypothetical protein
MRAFSVSFTNRRWKQTSWNWSHNCQVDNLYKILNHIPKVL